MNALSSTTRTRGFSSLEDTRSLPQRPHFDAAVAHEEKHAAPVVAARVFGDDRHVRARRSTSRTATTLRSPMLMPPDGIRLPNMLAPPTIFARTRSRRCAELAHLARAAAAPQSTETSPDSIGRATSLDSAAARAPVRRRVPRRRSSTIATHEPRPIVEIIRRSRPRSPRL